METNHIKKLINKQLKMEIISQKLAAKLPIKVKGIPYSNAEIAVHLPVPF